MNMDALNVVGLEMPNITGAIKAWATSDKISIENLLNSLNMYSHLDMGDKLTTNEVIWDEDDDAMPYPVVFW